MSISNAEGEFLSQIAHTLQTTPFSPREGSFANKKNNDWYQFTLSVEVAPSTSKSYNVYKYMKLI